MDWPDRYHHAAHIDRSSPGRFPHLPKTNLGLLLQRYDLDCQSQRRTQSWSRFALYTRKMSLLISALASRNFLLNLTFMVWVNACLCLESVTLESMISSDIFYYPDCPVISTDKFALATVHPDISTVERFMKRLITGMTSAWKQREATGWHRYHLHWQMSHLHSFGNLRFCSAGRTPAGPQHWLQQLLQHQLVNS